jgi:hypothetical protein
MADNSKKRSTLLATALLSISTPCRSQQSNNLSLDNPISIQQETPELQPTSKNSIGLLTSLQLYIFL